MDVPTAFETPRLSFRRLREADAPDIFEYCRDPEVTRYMDWPTNENVESVRGFIKTCMQRWESGEEYCWVIAIKPETRAIGHIGCRVQGHAVNFGYLFHRDHWGRGFATEATRAVVDLAFKFPSVARVWATCDRENVRSAHVLEKAGLEREGLLRRSAIRPNIGPSPRDNYVYAKVI